jgi:hypothetical protein
MALVNVDHTWTLWTPANEDAKIATVKWFERRHSREITTELELTQPKILKVFHNDHWHPYCYSQSAYLLSVTFVFLMNHPVLLYAPCPSRSESGTEYLLSYLKCTLRILILKCQEL